MSENIVKDLREKTEESNLDTILKTTTMGGYNRASVREYITMLRQQQYDLQQSFTERLQAAQTERDLMTVELNAANARAAAAEEALSQTDALRDKAAELEKDMGEAITRIQADAATIERQEKEIAALMQECDALRAKLQQSRDEAEALKQENEAIAAKAAEPVANEPESLQEQMVLLNRDRENAEKRMDDVIRNEKRLFQALNECRVEMENHREQYLCLEAENKTLSARLSEQICQNISLDCEITRMRTMNENLKVKLETVLAGSAKPYDGSDF
ncbi:MAG: hypothetical protein IKU58_04840 [Clostridia bacterium]|nr:hypothetical protein [Clostridia bacterium]